MNDNATTYGGVYLEQDQEPEFKYTSYSRKTSSKQVFHGYVATDTDERKRFEELKKQWKQDTLYTSSVREMVTHDAYMQIIGMGKRVLPLLLKQLEETDPAHWFVALKAITGNDPVPEESKGNVIEMAQAWLTWGEDHDYL